MENASKALYIAAGVLIAIMILGIFVYLFRAGGLLGENYEARQAQEQLQLFNSKFENFARDNNTISDMISVANLAIDNNEINEYNPRKTVGIVIKFSPTKNICVSDEESIERNYFFVGNPNENHIIYAYDLMNVTKNDIQEYKKNNDGKIVKAGWNSSILDGAIQVGDTLSTVDKNMRYKYYFKCTNIGYDNSTGRVESMEFEITPNSDYDDV